MLTFHQPSFQRKGNDTTVNLGIQTYSYKDEPGFPSKINKDWHNNPERMSESNRLAADIHSSLLAETGARDAGLLQATFAVLRETAKPAVLFGEWDIWIIRKKTKKSAAVTTKIN